MEEPAWWWTTLSYVTGEVRAAKLAEQFASGYHDPGAETGCYFDPAGQDLLAGLRLAAALDHRAIAHVYTWPARPTDDTAMEAHGKHGFTLTSDPAADVIEAPAKHRGGVHGAARLILGCIPMLNSLQSKSAVLALPSSDTCQRLFEGMRLHG